MSEIQLKDVSIRFKVNQAPSHRMKEALLRWIHPPSWSKNLSGSTQVVWGLKHLDLSIHEGDRLGIIGHNGAGKSTLLKVISRIYRPQSGEVSVRGRIAPLIEIGAGFNPELSGRENAYLNGAILGLNRKTIRSRMDSIIDFSELGDSIDMPVKYYSTGMHLRLAFTIATEVAPDILILDELFAGGDAAFLERANVRLKKFIEKSKILILVSHNLDYIREFCNRAIVLNQGGILGDGHPEDMIDLYLQKPLLST